MSDEKWFGDAPVICNICEFHLQDTFIDGRTKNGSWAIMCGSCHSDVGVGMGLGKGQRYDLKTLKFISTEKWDAIRHRILASV